MPFSQQVFTYGIGFFECDRGDLSREANKMQPSYGQSQTPALSNYWWAHTFLWAWLFSYKIALLFRRLTFLGLKKGVLVSGCPSLSHSSHVWRGWNARREFWKKKPKKYQNWHENRTIFDRERCRRWKIPINKNEPPHKHARQASENYSISNPARCFEQWLLAWLQLTWQRHTLLFV